MLSKHYLTFLFLVPVSFAELFQPLRKLEARGKSIPFYTCGDQQQSCDAVDQPVGLLDGMPNYFSHSLEYLLSSVNDLLPHFHDI